MDVREVREGGAVIRLTVLYHDDTKEPFAVVAVDTEGLSAPWLRETGSRAGEDQFGVLRGYGPLGGACLALLLRERAHWTAKKEDSDHD